MKWFLLFLAIPLVITTAEETSEKEFQEPKLWALIVAGSSGWYNYRHQADVCHAYQILHNHGIPDENIVVMMYNDIAQNKENPTPGIVVNHPAGKDVYHGVPHDYVGNDVTPQNFLKILQGDEPGMQNIGSGKVIKSGPNDHVFVNFVDHGASGIVGFPNGVLTVKELNIALVNMHKQRKYAQMVLYMEACESGSMFKNVLPKDINIYATTASNASESSYACYYDKKRGTYLGDWYSVHWMENSDKSNLKIETLIQQFEVTKKETNTSHVEEFGDISMGKEPVADFQGEEIPEPITYPPVEFSASPCYEVPLDILTRRHSLEKDSAKRQTIWEEMRTMQQKRTFVEEVIRAIVKRVSADGATELRLLKKRPQYITQLDCHTDVVHDFSRTCFNLGENPYALKYVYVLTNMCEEGISSSDISAVFNKVCSKLHTVQGGIH